VPTGSQRFWAAVQRLFETQGIAIGRRWSGDKDSPGTVYTWSSSDGKSAKTHTGRYADYQKPPRFDRHSGGSPLVLTELGPTQASLVPSSDWKPMSNLELRSKFRRSLLAIPVTALVLSACGASGATNAAIPKISMSRESTATTVAKPSSTTRVATAPSGSSHAAKGSASTPPSGSPPPPPGGGSGPGGNGSSKVVTGTGAFTLAGGQASKSDQAIMAASTNESGVLAKDSAKLTLTDVNVSTTGSSSSSDNSSFYGLDAGVLAFTGSAINESGGLVTTTGDGANAVFAYGSGSSITISDTKIKASGQYAHGIMASGGGSIKAINVTVSTAGASSAAVATDRGGGAITVIGGTFKTSGHNSPGLYSTGTLKATGATFDATGAEAAVVEGSNSVIVTSSHLTGHVNRGVMLYQSMSGDAQGEKGTFTETGGSLTALDGPLFFVTNTTAAINLTGVKLSDPSGTLLDAAASSWGTSEANGGNVTVNATRQSMTGAVDVDDISTAVLNLKDGSSLSGAINAAGTGKSVTLSLDKSSKWTVMGNSHLTVLRDSAGVSGSKVTNIVGDGHIVYYDANSNPWLGGRTYTLQGGGTLTPV